MSLLNTIKLKKTRCALIALALSAPLISSSVVVAQEQQSYPVERQWSGSESSDSMKKNLKRMAKKLELNQLQIEQIKQIAQQAKTENSELKSVMKTFKEKTKALMLVDYFDEQAFLLLHQEYQTTLTQIALVKAKTRHAILQVLSEEQKTKWLSMHEKKKQKRKHK
ncbi:MAG: Spy/CpxP family protein refolding chaperone [Colwellia sp.]|nr:Spy/CpxP family protein refolding chaperone [Colwellia sp.]